MTLILCKKENQIRKLGIEENLVRRLGIEESQRAWLPKETHKVQ